MAARFISRLKSYILLFSLVSATAHASDEMRANTHIGAADRETAHASRAARETLPHFFQRWESMKETNATFQVSIKVRRLDEPSRTEEIWIDRLNREDKERFSGRVALEPTYPVGLSKGDSLGFSKGEITDWAYWHNGFLHGGYITRVLVERYSEEKARFWRSKFAPLPEQ